MNINIWTQVLFFTLATNGFFYSNKKATWLVANHLHLLFWNHTLQKAISMKCNQILNIK